MISVIPILADSACGHCEPHDSGPGCLPAAPAKAAAPTLVGPADELNRLMHALRQDFAARGVHSADAVIRSLVLTPGEVELRIHAPTCHGGAGLIDLAFQCLRREMPDTDVFVLPAIPKIVAHPP